MEKVFTITEILEWYDGPLVVKGKTDTEQDVFAIVYDESDTHQTDGTMFWMAAVVAPEVMEGIVTNKMDLREVFTTHRLQHPYQGKFIGSVGEMIILTPFLQEPIPDDMIPDAGCTLYLGDSEL